MSKQTLYDITQDFLQLYDMIENEDIEIDGVTINDTLESLNFDLETKAINIAKVIKNIEFENASLKGREEFLKSELEKVKGSVTTRENKIKILKQNLLIAMEIANMPKIKNELFNIYPSKSIAVVIENEEKANLSEFAIKEVKYKVSKSDIKKAIQNGQAVDFAYLEERHSLIIR